MFYFHHVAWEIFSRVCLVPTLLFVAWRFAFGEVGIMSDWSKIHIREKYTSILQAYNPFDWNYDRDVENKTNPKKTDGDSKKIEEKIQLRGNWFGNDSYKGN